MFGHWVLDWLAVCVPLPFQCIAGYPLSRYTQTGRTPQCAIAGRVAQQDYG